MAISNELKIDNPRSFVSKDDWPSSGKKVTAEFTVETASKGLGKSKSRVSRVTINKGRKSKPKKTVYYDQVAIVDGDDGRLYIAANDSATGTYILIPGTLKETHYIYEKDYPDLYLNFTEIFVDVI